MSVCDKIDQHMVYHMLFHDIGEHAVGDLPYPVKHDNQLLKQCVDGLELGSYYKQIQYWGSFKQVLLNDNDKKLFKQIELTEMAEFGLDQMCLGSKYGFIVANRCLKAVYDSEPPAKLIVYIIKRLEIFRQQFRDFHAPDDWWLIRKWNEVLSGGTHGSE